MGQRELEAAILRELRVVAKNSKLRQKDIMEWSTGDVKAEAGETLYRLPELAVNVAVKTPNVEVSGDPPNGGASRSTAGFGDNLKGKT